jgi:hypothetical protein
VRDSRPPDSAHPILRINNAAVCTFMQGVPQHLKALHQQQQESADVGGTMAGGGHGLGFERRWLCRWMLMFEAIVGRQHVCVVCNAGFLLRVR